MIGPNGDTPVTIAPDAFSNGASGSHPLDGNPDGALDKSGLDRLARLAEVVPGALFAFRIRPDGTVQFPYLSPGYATLTGLSAADVCRDAGLAFKPVFPDDLPGLMQSIEVSARNLSLWVQEFRVQHPERGIVWIEGRSVPEREPDGSLLWHGVFLDVTDRKRAEREVSEQDKRIRSILESAPFGAHAYQLDSTGELVFAGFNAAAERILGTPHASFVGKPILEAFPDLRETSIPSTYRRVAEMGEHVESEQVVYHGGHIQGAFEIHAFQTGPGRMAVFFRDITERKKLDAELRDREHLMQESQEVSRIGSYNLDLATGEFQSSKVLDDILGMDETFTKNLAGWASLIHPEDQEATAAYMAEVSTSGSPGFHRDYRIVRHTDQQVRWMHGTGSLEYDASGQPIRMLGVIQDITERKEIEMALEQERRFTAAVFDSVPGLLYLYDAEGHLLRWNKQHEILTGYSSEELRTMTLLDWYKDSPEDIERITAAIQKAFTTGYAEAEGNLQTKDGKRILFLFNAVTFYYQEKLYFVGIGIDITERRRVEQEVLHLNETLEERVRQRTEALEAANQELDSFTYSVSHDLRAPLRSVDGFSLALMEDFGEQLPEDGRRYVGLIREGAQRMGALIEDLLTFSRMGRAPLKKQTVDMSALLKEVLAELSLDRPNAHLELQVDPLPSCPCDPALIRQVWLNLVSNAQKYSRKRDPAVIHVGFDAENDCYFVRDNGVGFDMKYVGKLFKVFQRLHRLEDFEGTGIGLALSRQIIGRHGGKIWAEAQPNEGAVFSFSIPDRGVAS